MSIKNLEAIAKLKTPAAVRAFRSRVNALWLEGKIGSALYFECRKFSAHQLYILKKSALAQIANYD